MLSWYIYISSCTISTLPAPFNNILNEPLPVAPTSGNSQDQIIKFSSRKVFTPFSLFQPEFPALMPNRPFQVPKTTKRGPLDTNWGPQNIWEINFFLYSSLFHLSYPKRTFEPYKITKRPFFKRSPRIFSKFSIGISGSLVNIVKQWIDDIH